MLNKNPNEIQFLFNKLIYRCPLKCVYFRKCLSDIFYSKVSNFV